MNSELFELLAPEVEKQIEILKENEKSGEGLTPANIGAPNHKALSKAQGDSNA